MEAKEYQDKAKHVLELFDEMVSKRSYNRLEDFRRYFTHLVYNFDKDLPLNREMEDLTIFEINFSTKEMEKVDIERIRNLIKFFINYIDDYYIYG